MRARTAVAVLAASLATLGGSPVARAAEVRAESAARRVAVGESFTVEVTAILDDGDGNARDPKLPIQGAADLSGPSIFSQRRVVMRNFDVTTENNVVATYEVTPTKPGRLVLGPGSFMVDGRRLEAETLVVEVVDGPAQGGPSGRSRRNRDPFGFGQDPFGQDPFGRDPFGQTPDPASPDPFDILRRRGGLSAYPDAPAELTLPSAPSEVGFLVAKVDQPTAVIGEPIVLSIYAYGGRGAFREVSPTEPALPDFLSYASVETSHEQPFFRTEIGGREFLVVKLRELVLVPLRAGQLEIGSMRAILRGRGYPSRNSPLGTLASSPPLTVTVREPPQADRPPGYRLGDVGRFELSAQVDPREVDQNGFFSVKLEVSGSGNVPATIDMPEIPGVVWGEPTVRGEVNVEDRDLAGSRTLEFTVRATSPGTIELGTVSLPHFDPATERYRIASAALGRITVASQAGSAPNSASNPSAASPSEEPSLLLALEPRTSKAPWRFARSGPPLWGLAAAVMAPGLVWLLLLLPAAVRGARARWTHGRSRQRHLDFAPLTALEKAKGRAEVAGELEHVTYRLLEEKTGLRARAILKEHLASRMRQAGVAGELADDLQALLIELDTARFHAARSTDEASSLVERARPVLLALWKTSPTRKAEA